MHMELVIPAVSGERPTAVQRQRNRGQTAKRATNLSLSADVLSAARVMNINVSQVCDRHLREVVRQEQARRWRAEHADFVAACNATIEAEGQPLDAWKTF